MKRILLTGCTGLIGRYLLRDLLVAGMEVAVLVRPAKRAPAALRLNQILADWQDALGQSLPRPEVLVGDLQSPGLGLDFDTQCWLAANIDAVLHNAGSVVFHQTEDGEPWRTNVAGTRNLVEFAVRAGIDEFHHMSSSYVCGDRQGVIYEHEADCDQAFDTDYEKSKLEAEKIVRSAGFKRLNVFRPCSVTGDSQTGYTSTYHGLYLVAQFTHFAQQRAGVKPGEVWNHPVRLFQDGSERHHFIPVDAVSRAVVEIMQRQAEGNTYHLTPVRPCSAESCEAALQNCFGYQGVRFVARNDRQQPFNPVEELFYAAVARAQHRYLLGDPTFDCTNTLHALPWWSHVSVDEAYLHRILQFAVSDSFGKARSKRRPSATLNHVAQSADQPSAEPPFADEPCADVA